MNRNMRAYMPDQLLSAAAAWFDLIIIQKIRSLIMTYSPSDYRGGPNTPTVSAGGGGGGGGRIAKLSLLLLSVALMAACIVVYEAGSSYGTLQILSGTSLSTKEHLQEEPVPEEEEEVDELLKVLRAASMPNKNVIVTAINEAWAAPKSVFDLFLESFRIGNGTSSLLKHVLVVALDSNAYSRCKELHPHCYLLGQVESLNVSSEAYYMSPKYLQIVWRKIEVQLSVLQYGYNFLFTDVDIMWFRNPFVHFYKDVDIQISCDACNRDPFDMRNKPNSGFSYVASTNRSIAFYNFWLNSQKTYPNLRTTQDVLNRIKFDPYIKTIGLRLRFMDPDCFGGFCQPSQDLNKVCTMHANCCSGLNRKIHDLNMLLEDWKTFMSWPQSQKVSQPFRWRVPNKCRVTLRSP